MDSLTENSKVKEIEFFPPSAFTQIPGNFVNCEKVGSSWGNCSLNQKEVVQHVYDDIELLYHFQYNFTCDAGDPDMKTEIRLPNGARSSERFNTLAVWLDIKLDSSQSISVVDEDPGALESMLFSDQNNCELRLRYRTELSKEQKGRLRVGFANFQASVASFRLLSSQAKHIELLKLAFVNLDLAGVQEQLQDYRQTIKNMFASDGSQSSLEAGIEQLDLIFALNPGLTYQEIQELIENSLTEIIQINDTFLDEYSENLARIRPTWSCSSA